MTSKIVWRTARHCGAHAAVAAGVAMALTLGMASWGAGAPAGGSGSLPPQIADTSGQDHYQDAFTLIDLPSEELVEAVPELSGLLPAANQQALPHLLSQMGQSVEASYQKLTQIVANEQVTQVQCVGAGHMETTFRQEFTYLLLPHHELRDERIEEYRSDINGKPVQGAETRAFFAEGFAAMWALFDPGNQSGSRFRYLGVQRLGGHTAEVIGFAQKPGWSEIREYAISEGQRVLILYQGVVWIDRATHKILKLRTDLLKPRIEVRLELQTTEIEFGEVHVTDAASTALWVPLQLTVTSVWNGRVFRDEHVYSNYRLPGSTSKIGPTP